MHKLYNICQQIHDLAMCLMVLADSHGQALCCCFDSSGKALCCYFDTIGQALCR